MIDRSADEQRKHEWKVILAYLDKIGSYNGEDFQCLREREDDNNYARVDTKLVDKKGQEFAINYRHYLYDMKGDWKVYVVVIENVSIVSNYRAQFNRVLASSSYEELINRMKGKL